MFSSGDGTSSRTADCSVAGSGASWHPLSASQLSLWVMYRLFPDQRGDYNIAFCARVVGIVDPERLERAVTLLAARHPMLRVRFRDLGEQPEQQAQSNVRVPVSIHDVRDVPSDRLKTQISRDTARPFRLD